MNPKIKNILLFVGILAVLAFAYMFLFGNKEEEPALISSTAGVDMSGTSTVAPMSPAAGEFLSVLLSVRSIKLDDSIFSDPAFLSLRDSSIELIPDGNEGRPNPFAPIGQDTVIMPEPVPSTGEAASPEQGG